MRKITILALSMLAVACSGGNGGQSTSTAGAPSTVSPPPSTMRKPIGLYAQLDTLPILQNYANQTALQNVVVQLASDPAVSGIRLGLQWQYLQPVDPATIDAGSRYDFWMLDAVLAGLEQVNRTSSIPKTLLLAVSPGFYSPPWLFDHLTSCDGYFCTSDPPVSGACDYAHFDDYPEMVKGGPNKLPLPWSPTYLQYWETFVHDLGVAYTARPELVGVEISGPVSSSPEIIMPKTVQDGECGWGAEAMWPVLMDPVHPEATDDPFVAAWTRAFRTYEADFSGLTLVVTPDDGDLLPGYKSTSYPQSPLYATQCVHTQAADAGGNATDQNESCAATARILDGFLALQGPNLLGDQIGGLTASSPNAFADGDMGLTAVKTFANPSFATPLVGGAEFDVPATEAANWQQMGCPTYPQSACSYMTSELAIFNTLATFFLGTQGGDVFHAEGVQAKGPSQLSYLAVRYVDVLYAQSLSGYCQPLPFARAPNTTAHYLLELANWNLSRPVMGDAKVMPAIPSPPTCLNPPMCTNGQCPPGMTCSGTTCELSCSGNACK